MSNETSESTAPAPVTQLSAATSAMVDIITAEIAAANKVASTLNSQGDTKKLVAEVRDELDTEDEFLLKYRKSLAELDERREQFVTAATKYVNDNGLVKTESLSQEQVDAKKAEFKQHQATIRTFRAALKALPNGDSAIEELPNVHSVSGMGGGAPAGRPRPRISAIEVTAPDGTKTDIYEDVADKEKGTTSRTVSFTVLRKWFDKNTDEKVDVPTLQNHAFEAAGTKDLSEATQVGFAVGKYQVTVTPKGSDA